MANDDNNNTVNVTMMLLELLSFVFFCWRVFALTEELGEASGAVSLVAMLLEGTTTQRVVAEGADKVLWMPLLAEGIDTASADRKTTTSADGASHLVVVLLAIGLALVLKVCTTSKALVAVEAREVLRMPLLTHGIDELTTDGLTTTSTFEREGRIEATLTESSTITL